MRTYHKLASLAFIGDCHLGYRHRFKAQRLRDYVRAFEEALGKALRLDPDAIVFTGDILHHPRPDPVSMRVAVKNLLVAARQCPVIVCIGNHEIEGHLGTTYSPLFSEIGEDIHVLSSENPHVTLKLGRKTYGFHGFEYLRSRERAEEKLKEVSSAVDADVNVLCIHQAIEGYMSPHELSMSSLREVAPYYDLVVSGHVHKYQPIRELCSEVPAFYCGATERTSFNEAANKTGFLYFESDLSEPRHVKVSSTQMSRIKKEFKGTPRELNELVEDILSQDHSPIIRVEVAAELDGDLLDVRRDWSSFEGGRTLLEVNVLPVGEELQVSFDQVSLDADLIREYFEKSGNTNRELEDLCIQLFEKYSR